jgi:drug/metabolite transporter (DMT)-like permease
MQPIKIAGTALIIAGIVFLAFGSFSYPKKSEQVKLGPVELSVTENKTINIPTWLGASVLIVGALLLLAGNKK